MKRRLFFPATFCCIAIAALLLGSCSQRGVRMPRHRKRRHCDCPTFSMNAATAAPQQKDYIIPYPPASEGTE